MLKRSVSAAMVLLLGSTIANGGLYAPAPVEVDVENGTALGDVYTARFSQNALEFIGCGVRFGVDDAGEATTFGFCQASDAQGTLLSCISVDRELLDAIRSISAFSFISFAVNELGECTSIGNSSQSIYLPRVLRPGQLADDD